MLAPLILLSRQIREQGEAAIKGKPAQAHTEELWIPQQLWVQELTQIHELWYPRVEMDSGIQETITSYLVCGTRGVECFGHVEAPAHQQRGNPSRSHITYPQILQYLSHQERKSLGWFDIAFSVVSALMVRVPLIWNTKRSHRNLDKEFCCKKMETIAHEYCFPSLPSPSLQPILFSLKVSPSAGCVYKRIHFPFPSTCHLL